MNFEDGLTILSGETGAGKSIIVNAVSLLLGSRASSDMVRTGAQQAELEALFEVPPAHPAAQAMATHGYESDEGLLVRRIISRHDRHKLYINGRLATMQTLSAITEHLASISGQHAHQGLLREDNHLQILDQFGDLMTLRRQVERQYGALLPLLAQHARLEARQGQQQQQADLLGHQQQEIEAAAVVLGEDADLEQDLQRLKNSEQLYGLIYGCVQTLYDRRGAAVEQLQGVQNDLTRAAQLDHSLASHLEPLTGATLHLEDLARELRTYLDVVQMDEVRLEAIEGRLNTLRELKRKYGGTLEAVLDHLAEVEQQLSVIGSLTEEIQLLVQHIDAQRQKLIASVEKLSQARRQAARRLECKVKTELASLKMPQAKFQIALEYCPAKAGAEPVLVHDGALIQAAGIDRARFLIATNIGEPLKPLASIASGGELSRLVLALKAILAQSEYLATVVFDEVDAGIGGSVAATVGRKLDHLAQVHQVLCITHLPQIAKFGQHHFRILKTVHGGRTRTCIEKLTREERTQELARMLGGVNITPATLEHAREMLQEKSL